MLEQLEQLRPYLFVVTGVFIVLVLLQRWRRSRRRRSATLHPSLARYAGPDSELAQQRRQAAARILTTSSSGHLSGYEIVEQIEAVYVDGFRAPGEALEGLKATAALKGANALTNVRHERTASGKCSASGDAVIAQRLTSPPPEPAEPPAPPQNG